MNPWNVIGWIIVVILAIPMTMLVLHIIRNLSLRVYNNTTEFFGYLRTRNKTPEGGQVWVNRRLTYKVENVTPDGYVRLISGRVSFVHNSTEWKKFIKRSRVRLLTNKKSDANA